MLDSRSWKKLRRNRVAVLSGGILLTLVLTAILGPMWMPASYGNPGPLQQVPPSWAHWMGTDLNGRDVLYRVLLGLRLSILVGLAGALLSLTIGTFYGMIAGYVGGRVDAVMMRLVDILYSIPRLIFILILINALNLQLQTWAAAKGLEWLVMYSRIVILIFSLGFIEWLTMARVVRGQILTLKERQYVTAARSLGQSHFKILTRHLLPNIIGLVVIYLTLTIPTVIIDESFLSFLGLGVQAPLASLGSLLADGANVINPVRSYWWLLVFPALAMGLLLLSLNFLGDAFRDVVE
ncbi:MAG: ABC transporter permease [Chthoniobacterales bacterium]